MVNTIKRRRPRGTKAPVARQQYLTEELEPKRHKGIEKLGAIYVDAKDSIKEAREEMKNARAEVLELMKAEGIPKYRFLVGERSWTIKLEDETKVTITADPEE